MTEEVVEADQVPPKVERSARALKGTSQLFITMAFSFFGECILQSRCVT